MKNKRGSHVGMVLSFVIFITFLVYLYAALEPTIRKDKDKQFLIEHLKTELPNQFAGNLTIVTVSGKGFINGKNNCLVIKYSDIGQGYYAKESLTKNKYEAIVKQLPTGDGMKIEWETEADNIFKIYFSEETLEEGAPANCNKDVDTKIELVNEQSYIFESVVEELSSEEHQTLLTNLGFPAGYDFYFNVTNEDRKETIAGNGNANADVSANIYSEEIPIQYINKTAELNSGFLTIKVW